MKLVGGCADHMGVGAEAQGGARALARVASSVTQAGTSYHPARCSE